MRPPGRDPLDPPAAPRPVNPRAEGDRLFGVRLFYQEPTYALEADVERVAPYSATYDAWGRDPAAALAAARAAFEETALASGAAWLRVIVGYLAWERSKITAAASPRLAR